jgi:sodium transport system permease protein
VPLAPREHAVDASASSPPSIPAPESRRSLRRVERLWREFASIAWLFGLLLGTSVVGVVVNTCVEGQSVLIDAILAAVDAVIVVVFVVRGASLVKPYLVRVGLGPRQAIELLLGFVVMAGIISAYFEVAEAIGIPVVQFLPDYVAQGWPLWSAYVLIAVMPAVFEELAFRGYILAQLDRWLRPGEALFVQAALFSVLHVSVAVFLSHFIMGLGLGLLRRRTHSLYPGMLAHGCWNAWVVTAELLG